MAVESPVTICMMQSDSQKFEKTLVSFTSTYVTDMQHSSFLKDDDCPDYVLDVFDAPDAGDQGLKAFNVELDKRSLSPGLLEYEVEGAGMFVPAANNDRARIYLKAVKSFRLVDRAPTKPSASTDH